MGDQLAASPRAARRASVLAARVTASGYKVVFPPGRDPATFKVDRLPGVPDVEVSVEDDGRVSCHFTGTSQAQAAVVIARMPVPGHPDVQALTGDTLTATWGGIEIAWEHVPPAGRHLAGVAAAELLAHLAVLRGGHQDDGEDEET